MIKCMLAAALLLSTSPASIAPSLIQAQDAYDQNKIADARQLFEAVAADSQASPDDRAGANLALARIAWLIDADADLALRRLNAARAANAKTCEVSETISRVLSESKRSAEAIAAEPKLLEACNVSAKRDPIRLNIIAARLDRAMEVPADRKSLLQQTSAEEGLLTENAGGDGARVRLDSALLAGDSVAALAAWKDYYWLTDSDAPPALAQFDPASLFRRGLSDKASDADRVDLSYLLMRAGFADGLTHFASTFRVAAKAPPSRWKLVQTYLEQRKLLSGVALEVNRSLARGGSKDDPRLQKAALESLGALMGAAGASGDPRKALRDHYGLIGSVGLTSGYPSLHIGHVVEDRTQTVRQYGHEATIHFAVVDNMWANGFESWLWDGSAETGGWSGDDTIIEVRSAYTPGPASAYALVGDGAARRELLAQIPALAVDDLAKARSGVPSTLAGLNARLRLQLVDEVAAVPKMSSGATGFRRAFLAEYWRATNQHSIFIHEGRHAIDKAMAPDPSKLDSATLEYQANLSELALSDYPRMALWNLNRGIGGSTPHDQASTRIIGHFARWIEAHPQAVAGYDPSLPAVVQIDRLTGGQMREIARSLDPLANGHAAIASAGSRSGTSRR